MKAHVKETQVEISYTIDAFGAGMSESNRLIANTFRQADAKSEIDYSAVEKKISKTELFKKLQLMKKKILKGTELILVNMI